VGVLLHDPPIHDSDADGQMNDPHVESLRYRFEPTEGNKFDAPPIVWNTAEVDFDLGNGYLIARPKSTILTSSRRLLASSRWFGSGK